MDSVDNTIGLETPQTLAPQPKPALSLPTELWNDIINLLDIDSLYSLCQTCVALSTWVRSRLIEELALSPPLDDLYTLTKKKNPDLPFYDCVFRMHLYVDDLLGEPKDKKAHNYYEWKGHDSNLAAQENDDNFQYQLNRKRGGTETREWANWNRRVFETRCLLRRQLARLWAADGRFLPFINNEYKQWKQRKERRGCIVDLPSGFRRRGLHHQLKREAEQYKKRKERLKENF